MRWAELGTAVQSTIVGVFALLVLSTLGVMALCRWRPDRRWEELTQRIYTWWFLAGFFSLALMAGNTATIIFFFLLSFLALKEFLSLIPTRRADRRVLFWAYLAIPIQYVWVYAEWYGMFVVFIPVYMFLLLPLRMVSIGQTDGFVRAVGTLHWGLMTTVYCVSHAAFLVILRLKHAESLQVVGPGLVVYLVVLTELNDVVQYLVDRFVGRRQMIPHVSAGTTWVGSATGVVTTLVLAVLAGPWLTPLSYSQAVVAGLIIGIGGVAGDLCISAIKRDLHIEASGCWLPGHGGILDRITSLSYTAPLFFHFVYWLFLFHTYGARPFVR